MKTSSLPHSLPHNMRGKILYKFLIRKNLLGIYVRAVVNCSNKKDAVRKYLECHDIIGLTSHMQSIGNSFIWATTKEGHNFWSKLDDEFYDYLRKWRNDNPNIS